MKNAKSNTVIHPKDIAVILISIAVLLYTALLLNAMGNDELALKYTIMAGNTNTIGANQVNYQIAYQACIVNKPQFTKNLSSSFFYNTQGYLIDYYYISNASAGCGNFSKFQSGVSNQHENVLDAFSQKYVDKARHLNPFYKPNVTIPSPNFSTWHNVDLGIHGNCFITSIKALNQSGWEFNITNTTYGNLILSYVGNLKQYVPIVQGSIGGGLFGIWGDIYTTVKGINDYDLGQLNNGNCTTIFYNRIQ